MRDDRPSILRLAIRCNEAKKATLSGNALCQTFLRWENVSLPSRLVSHCNAGTHISLTSDGAHNNDPHSNHLRKCYRKPLIPSHRDQTYACCDSDFICPTITERQSEFRSRRRKLRHRNCAVAT